VLPRLDQPRADFESRGFCQIRLDQPRVTTFWSRLRLWSRLVVDSGRFFLLLLFPFFHHYTSGSF
jgi:hypothetical protein